MPELAGVELVQTIGQGGMGAVYLARQTTLNRYVAAKQILGVWNGDPEMLARFQREARALAQLNHPNVVAIYDLTAAGSDLFMIMEYVRGPSLRQIIDHQMLTPQQALHVLGDVAAALEYASKHGIVHRDLKPSNVFVTLSGTSKLGDFGLVKMLSAQANFQTQAGTILGTPAYMSPEQADGESEVDHRSDIYSLAVMSYELLVGRLPFPTIPGNVMASLYAHVSQPPPRPSELVPGFPQPVETVLLAGLAKAPGDRPASAGEFWQRLRDAAAKAWPSAIGEVSLATIALAAAPPAPPPLPPPGAPSTPALPPVVVSDATRPVSTPAPAVPQPPPLSTTPPPAFSANPTATPAAPATDETVARPGPDETLARPVGGTSPDETVARPVGGSSPDETVARPVGGTSPGETVARPMGGPALDETVAMSGPGTLLPPPLAPPLPPLPAAAGGAAPAMAAAPAPTPMPAAPVIAPRDTPLIETPVYKPPATKTRGRGGALRFVLIVVLLLGIVLIGAGAFAVLSQGQFFGAGTPLTVSAVSNSVNPGAGHCPNSMYVFTGHVRTNGAGGDITYQWVKPDGSTTDQAVAQVKKGESDAVATLQFTYQGNGNAEGDAVLRVLKPTNISSQAAHITYSCP